MTDSERDFLANHAAAGLIAGEAYADEMAKMAELHLIDELIEKKAVDEKTAAGAMDLVKKLVTGPIGKGLAFGGATATGGFAAGQHLGGQKAEEEASEKIRQLAPKVFRSGFVHGARHGFQRGARLGIVHGMKLQPTPETAAKL